MHNVLGYSLAFICIKQVAFLHCILVTHCSDYLSFIYSLYIHGLCCVLYTRYTLVISLRLWLCGNLHVLLWHQCDPDIFVDVLTGLQFFVVLLLNMLWYLYCVCGFLLELNIHVNVHLNICVHILPLEWLFHSSFHPKKKKCYSLFFLNRNFVKKEIFFFFGSFACFFWSFSSILDIFLLRIMTWVFTI